MGLKIKKILLIAPKGLYAKMRLSRESRVTPQNFPSNFPQGIFIIDSNQVKHILRIGDLPHLIKKEIIEKMFYRGLPFFKDLSQYKVLPKKSEVFLETVLKAREGDHGAINYLERLDYLRPNEISKVEPVLYGNYRALIQYYIDEQIARALPLMTRNLKNIGFNVISVRDYKNSKKFLRACKDLAEREDLAFAIGPDYDSLDQYLNKKIPYVKIKTIKLLFPFDYKSSWMGKLPWQTKYISFVFYPKDLHFPFSLEEIRGEPEKIFTLPEMIP